MVIRWFGISAVKRICFAIFLNYILVNLTWFLKVWHCLRSSFYLLVFVCFGLILALKCYELFIENHNRSSWLLRNHALLLKFFVNDLTYVFKFGFASFQMWISSGNVFSCLFVFGLRSLCRTEIIRFPLMGLAHFGCQVCIVGNCIFTFFFCGHLHSGRIILSFASIFRWIFSLSGTPCFNLELRLDHFQRFPNAFELSVLIVLLSLRRSVHRKRPVG